MDENNKIIATKEPEKEVKFNLQENVVFSAEELQQRAVQLYEKYGANQVILYDEGRQGLDSARTMESVNKAMEDFLQECGFMGHVIIIVLPNFFKLHEDYAVARSIFLIDVFADENFNRGYFNFYNERQKENLYYFGKKRIGVTAKYMSAYESFWGKFTAWMPFDKIEYEKLKKSAIEQKRLKRKEKNLLLQRNALIWIMKKKQKMKYKEIREALLSEWDINLTENRMAHIISNLNEIKMREKGLYSV